MPYSATKTAQISHSIAVNVRIPELSLYMRGRTSSATIVRDRRSIGAAVRRSKLARASALLAQACIVAKLQDFRISVG